MLFGRESAQTRRRRRVSQTSPSEVILIANIVYYYHSLHDRATDAYLFPERTSRGVLELLSQWDASNTHEGTRHYTHGQHM